MRVQAGRLGIAFLFMALIGAGAVANAAAPDDGDDGGHSYSRRDDYRHAPRLQCHDVEARTAGRLAYLQAKLGITDMQRDAWTKFSVALQGVDAVTKDACKQLEQETGEKDLPAKVKRASIVAHAEAARLDKLAPAIGDLYKVLTPQQRQSADHSGAFDIE